MEGSMANTSRIAELRTSVKAAIGPANIPVAMERVLTWKFNVWFTLLAAFQYYGLPKE